ncbi:MAG: class I SAM-dependent methyltransferase [Planctomycetota bacterium]|nr:MAG: class I SAM-dependent methyltransferase [Planctomycetota bacterium]
MVDNTPERDRPRETDDPSAGYEAIAQRFVTLRESSRVGAALVARWAERLPPGARVLDLGCGAGRPVSELLVARGCEVYGIDASPTLLALFRRRFPTAPTRCEPVQTSTLFGIAFDAAVAIGLVFLLPPLAQRRLIERVRAALRPGGRWLFSAPVERGRWRDVLTGRTCWSLGRRLYRRQLLRAGFREIHEEQDEGGNHHYDARA